MSGYHDATADLMDLLASMMDREPVATFTNPVVIKAALDLAECVLDKLGAARERDVEVDALERLYAQRARRSDQRHPARPER